MGDHRARGLVWLLLSICIFGWPAPPVVDAGGFYKNYLIRQDRGRDILCEPYTVKTDDWIYKVFRETGEISRQDFPEFLRIFKQLNPHIHNLDIIRPGQQILIPLKTVPKNSFPDQTNGLVSIPFVNISNLPELISSYSSAHEVQKGDFVSRLVGRQYADYGTQAYEEGIRLFRYLNPKVSDLDLIYPGQTLLIPSASIRAQPWYRSLFDHFGKLVDVKNLAQTATSPADARSQTVAESLPQGSQDPFGEAASILDGKLLNHGIYYFPQQGKADLKLDLSQYPLIEFKDGARILFTRNEKAEPLDLKVLQSFWKDLSIASISPDADMEQVLDAVIESNKNLSPIDHLSFSDRGILVDIRARWILDRTSPGEKLPRYVCITFVNTRQEMTAEAVLNYLEQRRITIWDIQRKESGLPETNRPPESEAAQVERPGRLVQLPSADRRRFVEKLTEALGYRFVQDAPIRIEADGAAFTVICPQVIGSAGFEAILDVGNLERDVAAKLERSGRKVIRAAQNYQPTHLIEDMLRTLEQKYSVNPVFFGARRAAYHNIRITVPGFLVGGTGGAGSLITTAPLNEELVRFLRRDGSQIIFLQ